MKFIRLDEDHFAYVVGGDLKEEFGKRIRALFEEWWPGKKIIVIRADEFVAQPGEYEVVRAEREDLEVTNYSGREPLVRTVADGSAGMRRGE